MRPATASAPDSEPVRPRGPFYRLSPSRQRRTMELLAAGAAVQLAFFLRFERRMTRTGGPGIIAFELAGEDGSAAILQRWGESGRAAARSSLRLDFVFPATYAPLQALGCLAAARDESSLTAEPSVTSF